VGARYKLVGAGLTRINMETCSDIYSLGPHQLLGKTGLPVIEDTTFAMWATLGDEESSNSGRKSPSNNALVPIFKRSFAKVPLTRPLHAPGTHGCWEDVYECLHLNATLS
jgi:hypothetical protein